MTLPEMDSIEPVPFGTKMRKKYFGIDDKIVNLNHGSFGNCPIPVTQARFKLIEECSSFPDDFFKYKIYSYVPIARKAAAELLDADINNVVLVENATTALNTVLRSFPLKKGDKFIYCSTIYGSTLNTLKFLEKSVGIEIILVDLIYPMNNDEVVAAYTKAMDEHEDAKFCVFDVISSAPSALVPWERLVDECKMRNVISVVDGAHGAGLVPISLNSTRPDFFTTNFHKWVCSPNSCAVLYVDEKWHKTIHTLPISGFYVAGDDEVPDETKRFSNQFDYRGTIDYSPLLSIVYAIQFRKAIGGEDKIREYCFDLAKRGGYLICRQLDSEVLHGKNDDILTSMVNIRIPLDIPQDELDKAAKFFNDTCKEKFLTFMPVFVYNKQLWVRVSAQIYLELEDFQYGASILKKVIAMYEEMRDDGHKGGMVV